MDCSSHDCAVRRYGILRQVSMVPDEKIGGVGGVDGVGGGGGENESSRIHQGIE